MIRGAAVNVTLEEPYALIAHVRVCGGLRRSGGFPPAGSTRRCAEV
jgi:hypothetical protein